MGTQEKDPWGVNPAKLLTHNFLQVWSCQNSCMIFAGDGFSASHQWLCVSPSGSGHRRAAYHEGHCPVFKTVWGRADTGAPGAPPAGGSVQTAGAAAHWHQQLAAFSADDAAQDHQVRRWGKMENWELMILVMIWSNTQRLWNWEAPRQ